MLWILLMYFSLDLSDTKLAIESLSYVGYYKVMVDLTLFLTNGTTTDK